MAFVLGMQIILWLETIFIVSHAVFGINPIPLSIKNMSYAIRATALVEINLGLLLYLTKGKNKLILLTVPQFIKMFTFMTVGGWLYLWQVTELP